MKIEVYSPTIRRKEMSAVLTAMVEDKIGPGEQAKLLLQAAREKVEFDNSLALRSPVIALYLALKSLGLEKGQGVAISTLSPLYYTRVIEDLGLSILYCDVQPSTPCVSREAVEKALDSKAGEIDLRCIILHHTLGYLCDVAAIGELGIPVIEDCSQSYGTFGQEAGFLTILGLEERDMLTSGGGALLYSVNRKAARQKDGAVLRGFKVPLGNFRFPQDLPPEYGLPDMNASLAIVQFKEAEKNLLKRKEIAALYTQSAQRTRHKWFVRDDYEYNNYAFPLILETGVKDVKSYARRKEIAVESAFENTPIGRGMVPPEQCPEAYSLSLRTVLFPLYPRLGMADAGKVAKLIQTLP